MIPEVGNAWYVNKINSCLHGIADSNDIEKRQIADNILKYGNTFEAISFRLPNGDMYMEEPYKRQLDLTRNNFAFRDYYKGAIETKQSLLGIWSGVLNVSKFNNILQTLSHPDDTRVFIF